MQIIPAFVTQNKCYQAGAPLTPRGIMLHSVGTPQPSAAVFARSFNQYQPGGVSVCVHAFAHLPRQRLIYRAVRLRERVHADRRCRGRCAAGTAAGAPILRTSG